MEFFSKLKRVAETIGLACFVLLALYGMIAFVRGDPIRAVFAQTDQPQAGQTDSPSVTLVETSATVPPVIHYQGELRNAAGELLEGTYNLIFSIYDTAVGGTALFTEGHANVPVRSGISVYCWAISRLCPTVCSPARTALSD